MFPPPTASFPAGKVFSLLEGMLGVGMFGVRMLGEWTIKSGDAWGVRSKDAWDQERSAEGCLKQECSVKAWGWNVWRGDAESGNVWVKMLGVRTLGAGTFGAGTLGAGTFGSRDIGSRDTSSRDTRSRDAQRCGQASDASADAPSGCSHWSSFWEAGCRSQATACVPTTLRLPSAARSRAGSRQLARAGGKAWHGTEPRQAAGSGRTGREPSS